MSDINAVNPGLEASGDTVYCASARTSFRVAIEDLTATAATATQLLAPLTFPGGKIIPIGPRTTRLILRARLTSATTAVATSPVVRLYSFAGTLEPANSLVPIGRIDADTWTAAGVTLTLPGSPSATTMLTVEVDSVTYRYGDTLPAASTGVGYDCLGGRYILALTETAASITGGAAVLEIGVLN